MTNKEQYKEFCKSTYVSVFSKPWWLDAVCEDGYWDVLIYEKDNQVIGALPYYVRKILGISFIAQPKLTQNSGVIIKYPENISHSKKLSLEKEVMTALIEQLEKLPIAFYLQTFHLNVTNWLPFYWRGYKQQTNYTYRISNIKDHESVFAGYDHSKRKNIKKAKEIVTVSFDLTKDEFYENHKETLAKQGATIKYSKELFARIYDAAYKENSGKTIYAKDNEGNLHCALFVIWDEKSAYDLISTIDPEFRNIGAASLLVSEIIKYTSDFVDIFDFEGSMIENIESSFRKFGAIQTPYFRIHKIFTNNHLIRFIVNKKLKV